MSENDREREWIQKNNHIQELKVKRLIRICWMKSRAESRYWNEFYQYEQWLINHDLQNWSKCYSLIHQMGGEYLIELNGYIEMMKRYKKNVVKVKVSRLIQYLSNIITLHAICWEILSLYYRMELIVILNHYCLGYWHSMKRKE